MHLRAVHLHVKTKLITNVLDELEAFLVVGTGTTHPNLDVVLDKQRGNLSQGLDDTLERGGDIGEVGDTTTDEENLALGAHRRTEHEVENSAGVVEGLRLGGSTGVFTVVGKLVGEAGRCDSIGIDDGSTSTSNESPNTAGCVEDSEFERGTGLGVHLGDVGLLLAHLTTEGSGELHGRTGINVSLCTSSVRNRHSQSHRAAGNSPFRTALKLSSLIELGSEIEEVDLSRSLIFVGDNNEGVDLKITIREVSEVIPDGTRPLLT